MRAHAYARTRSLLRRRAMLAEKLLTPIAQPHAQRLWNFLPLLIRK